MSNLPEKINSAVKSSGVELSKAEAIAANYAPFMEQIAAQSEIVKGLTLGDPKDVEKAKRVRIDIGKICSSVGEQKTKDKAEVLVVGRFIDSLFNTVEGYGRLTQSDAKEIETHAEQIETKRLSDLRESRLAELVEFEGIEPMGVAAMSPDVWGNYLAGVKVAFTAKKEAEEAARVAAEQVAIAEQARLAEQAAENVRLKAEADAREKVIALEREQAEAARKLAEDIAAKEIAAANVKAKAEADAREKVEAELKDKKDAEAKALADIAAANAQAEADRIKAAKAPVKIKLTKWVESFELPTTDVDNETTKDIDAKFESFKTWAKSLIEKQ